MKGKYKFLLDIKCLDFQINQLILYSQINSECFELLKEKLDYLSNFILDKDNMKKWETWSENIDILKNACNLRETSCKAISCVEKYQANCILSRILDDFNYTTKLSRTVKEEINDIGIEKKSKVIFVGSGAMPISALSIAKEIDSEVICLDIDKEAIELSKSVAIRYGINNIKFLNKKVEDISLEKDITHIIIASLVKEKDSLIEFLRDKISDNTKIILRYGNGLKSIFNYPLECQCLDKWKKREISNQNNIYETLVLEK